MIRSLYMEWAKGRSRPRIDLAGSNLLACTLEDLPAAREDVDVAGESPDGYPPLVAAIAARFGTAPENVATGVGCAGAAFLAFAALLDPGEEALVERPGYDPLTGALRRLGARVRFFDRDAAAGFALDPDAVGRAVGPETRLVVVTNPHNPSGVAASREVLAALGEVVARANVVAVVDEVYRETLFGPDRTPPAAAISPSLVSVNSLTKSYGLASLRCGWALAAPEIARRVRRARDVVDGWSPIPSDRMACVAFRHADALEARARRIFDANRRLARERLVARPELAVPPFRASLAFPRFADGRDAGPFAEALFEREGVAVVPGAFFGMPTHFRVSLGGAPEKFAEGMAAIERVLDGM